MSVQIHPWCSDPARDEAIRRAEDAAAAQRAPLPDHRELPQAVAELRERVGRLEAVTNPRPEATTGSESVTPGLRTERVTLRERTPGEAAAYAEGMTATVLTDLIRARNDAREECDRLRARVAELEAAPAANAGGEANRQGSLDGSQEPVAWGFPSEDGSLANVSTTQPFPSTSIVVPLYAAPQQPRGWLTEEERETLEDAADAAESWGRPSPSAKVIRALLARSTPPRVKVPKAYVEAVEVYRDMVIAAIREAGGEVE